MKPLYLPKTDNSKLTNKNFKIIEKDLFKYIESNWKK